METSKAYSPYSIKFVKNILSNNNLWLSKNRGQNYLIDKNIAAKITDSIPVGSVVFEVGSGLGALTLPLCQLFKIYSLEIDAGVYKALSSLLINPNLTLIHNDFLKFDFGSIPEDKLFFVSNLPYSISGEAVKNFIANNKFTGGVIMLQEEFVERMKAEPKTKSYSPLSIICQSFLEMQELFKVGRDSFFPSPTVDSVVVSLKKKEADIDQEGFMSFLRSAFMSKRKTIWNNLKNTLDSETALTSIGINPKSRPEEITPDLWIKLSLSINRK